MVAPNNVLNIQQLQRIQTRNVSTTLSQKTGLTKHQLWKRIQMYIFDRNDCIKHKLVNRTGEVTVLSLAITVGVSSQRHEEFYTIHHLDFYMRHQLYEPNQASEIHI